VVFSASIQPACLPDPTETFAYEQGVITGWGYTEKTKVLKPRPLTSDVLREAEIFILPQARQWCRGGWEPLPPRPSATSTRPSPSPTGWSAHSR
jgi:hypothetical protein